MNRLRSLSLLIATWGLLACQDRPLDSVILVTVTAPPELAGVMQLRVSSSNAGATDVRHFPERRPEVAAAIRWPASLALVTPPGRGGRVDVVVEALDAAGQPLGHGAGEVDLVRGEQVDVALMLQAGGRPCGNARLDPGEACDDGNRWSGDGCTHRCAREAAADGGSKPDTYMGADSPPVADGRMPTGLVLYWKLDDTGSSAADSSGNDFHGSYRGESGLPMRSTDVPELGFPNPASRAFAAASRQAIQLADAPAALRPANNFTVSAWYRATVVQGMGAEIVSAGNQYILRLRPQVFEFAKRVSGPAGPVWVNCPGSSPDHLDGKWHHLAAAASSTGVKVYYDGAERCSLPHTQDVIYDVAPDLWVGRHGNGQTTWDFDGHVDDIRIYNRVLTAVEIASLASGGT